MKKRLGPLDVEPITLGNTRYEVFHWGKSRDLGQNGGHIVAVDATTGKELWIARLYETHYVPNMEDDKQDIFVTSIELDSGGSRIIAEDERGRRFALDLFSRRTTPL